MSGRRPATVKPRFDADLLDAIRARVSPSRLIGRTVALKPAGREMRGLSPFNKEKTPSFYVNDEKRRYFCFSSGKSGDVFTWLMETEGLSFPDAVERLAQEAGVALPKPTPEAAAVARRRKGLGELVETAAVRFRNALTGPEGGAARAYLARRGLEEAAWADYEIGFAPAGWRSLSDALRREGAEEGDLVGAGLAARSRKGEGVFDYFRNRITFAIRDPGGRLVGFGGRALDPDDPAKYLNSPETDLFHKGSALYRFHEARAAIARAKSAERPRGILVAEGYFDVIALARAGLAHAAAPLGTALTPEQLDLLWKAGPEPVLCFDGDAAGRRAAYRAIDRALPLIAPDRTLRFTLLGGGEDPDDVLRKRGPEALRNALATPRPLVDLLWERELEAAPLDTPERRADLRRRLMAASAKIEDRGLASQYRLELSDRFDAKFGYAARRARSIGRDRGPRDLRLDGPPRPETKGARPADAVAQAEARRLIALLLARPDLIEPCAEALASLPCGEGELAGLRDALVDLAFAGETIDKSRLDDHFRPAGLEEAAVRVDTDPSFDVVRREARRGALAPLAQAWIRDAASAAAAARRAQDEDAVRLAARAGRAAGDETMLRAAAAAARADMGDAPAAADDDGEAAFAAALARAEASAARMTSRFARRRRR